MSASKHRTVLRIIMLITVGFTNFPLQAVAESGSIEPDTFGTCASLSRSPDDIEVLISAAERNTVPVSGTLLPSSVKSGQPGASYSAEVLKDDGPSDADRLLSLSLDGREWISSGVFLSFTEFAPDPLQFYQLAEISTMLRNWSACTVDRSFQQLLNFVSNYGISWLFSPGDPLLASLSPVGAVASQSSATGALGSLPLLLIEARQLSDGRAALVIGEGSSVTAGGKLATPRVPSSLWLVDRTADGWKIDAVFAGFSSALPSFIVI
jgi:hypothetical protein